MQFTDLFTIAALKDTQSSEMATILNTLIILTMFITNFSNNNNNNALFGACVRSRTHSVMKEIITQAVLFVTENAALSNSPRVTASMS